VRPLTGTTTRDNAHADIVVDDLRELTPALMRDLIFAGQTGLGFHAKHFCRGAGVDNQAPDAPLKVVKAVPDNGTAMSIRTEGDPHHVTSEGTACRWWRRRIVSVLARAVGDVADVRSGKAPA
jgi:hypothetical protein